jgi:hypothetical protein
MHFFWLFDIVTLSWKYYHYGCLLMKMNFLQHVVGTHFTEWWEIIHSLFHEIVLVESSHTPDPL